MSCETVAERQRILHVGSVGTSVELVDVPGIGQAVAKTAVGNGVFGNGRDKLLYEAWFFRCQEARARNLFVELLDVQISPERVTLLMRFCCGGYTLEDMLSEPSRGEDCTTAVEAVLQGLHEHLHAPTATEARPMAEKWLPSYMDSRIDGRLAELETAPVRDRISHWAERSVITRELLSAAKQTRAYRAAARATRLSLTHGDLTSPNILLDGCDATRFKLIDPTRSPINNCPFSDPAEDVFRLFEYVDAVADGVFYQSRHEQFRAHGSLAGDTSLLKSGHSWESTSRLLSRSDALDILRDFYPCEDLLAARRLLIGAGYTFGVAARRLAEGQVQIGERLWDRSIRSLERFLSYFN